MTSQSPKNLDLQFLRGVAILLVIMQHYRARMPTPDIYNRLFTHFNFWPGVDIFFAISGFLICKTFLHDLECAKTKAEAVKSFWRRRVARLLPAAVFWCLASIVVSAVVTTWPGAEPAKVAKSAVAAIFGVSNFYWSSCVQFTLSCGSADFNGVTWSLSLEWQLYVLITFLMCIAGTRRAVILMLMLSVAVSIFMAPNFSYPWALRPQSFTLGATIYLLTKNFRFVALPVPRNVWPIATIIGTVICITAPIDVAQPFTIPVISLGAALCLLSALHGNILTASAISSVLVWIGERSYSIYLCHLPIFLLTHEILVRTVGIDPQPAHIALGLGIAITSICIFGHLSYRFIEIPFQKIQRNAATP